MDKIINHAVLSLDFWQDTVTYEGSTMPTGTIGCEVLNIPDSTIEKLDTPCNVLNQLLQGMNTGSVDMGLLPQVQQAAEEAKKPKKGIMSRMAKMMEDDDDHEISGINALPPRVSRDEAYRPAKKPTPSGKSKR